MRIPRRVYKQEYIGPSKKHLLSALGPLPYFYRHIVFVSSACTKLSIHQSTAMDEHTEITHMCVRVRKTSLLRKRICVLNILFESLLFVASLFCGQPASSVGKLIFSLYTFFFILLLCFLFGQRCRIHSPIFAQLVAAWKLPYHVVAANKLACSICM